jgi:hypothetical protein
MFKFNTDIVIPVFTSDTKATAGYWIKKEILLLVYLNKSTKVYDEFHHLS